MNHKKSKNKNNSYNRILYIVGSVALVFMLVFSAVNFKRDARVLKLPILSKPAVTTK